MLNTRSIGNQADVGFPVTHWPYQNIHRLFYIIELYSIFFKNVFLASMIGEHCIGKHSMPLNVDTVKFEERQYVPITFEGFGEMPEDTLIENKEDTVVISMHFSESIPTISSGPMTSSLYGLECIYFYWLTKSRPEYDHEDLAFPAELHLVFYNIEYGNVTQALTKKGGLVILAFGMNVSKSAFTYQNCEYFPFTNLRQIASDLDIATICLYRPKFFFVHKIICFNLHEV